MANTNNGKTNNNNVKVTRGGELGVYQSVITQNDSLKIWFKPNISGELGEEGLTKLKDSLKIEMTVIPLTGEQLTFIPDVSPRAYKAKVFFSFTANDVQKIIKNYKFDPPEGTIIIRVLLEESSGDREFPTYMDLEVSDEVELVSEGNQAPALLSTANDSLSEIADIDTLNVNVLKTTFNKRALSIVFKSIDDGAERISFKRYKEYVDRIFCLGPVEDKAFSTFEQRRFLPFNDTDSYRVLKIATEAFLMVNAGICCNLNEIDSEEDLIKYFAKLDIRFAAGDTEKFSSIWENYLKEENEISILPYLYLIRQKFGDVNITTNWIDKIIEEELCKCDLDRTELQERCFGIVRQRLQCPLFLELIWSYWQEEGMLVQGMNAISRRFQNISLPGKKDPLKEMEISHLRPLNNLLWGYIQDEQHRLNVVRRAYEYDHHYGIVLKGKAVPALNSADSRTRFIEAFHGLLNLTSKYYNDSANKLVDPITFPLLNALREVHFIIAEGMHNQYGDLPSTARIEMLMQQWILARPEFREFLPGRAAIPFTEPWMDRVASMNKLQGWTDTSPIHFDYLAKYGEQILLSIRFGDWSDQDRTAEDAKLWANHFRNQIQGYIHSYKTVTGVDLAITLVGQQKIDSRQPSFHLAKRLKAKQTGRMSKPFVKGRPVKKNVQKEW